MKAKNILVIGGNGFLGKNMCQYFASKEEKVYSFDINDPEEKSTAIEYITGDFFKDGDIEKAIENKDVIIHAISTVNPGNSNVRYLEGYANDFIQSIKLFKMAIERQIKVIFISSGGTVYGVQKDQPIKEEQLPLPINHYGTVKLCIENVIRTFNKQCNTKLLIARVSNPYGPGQDYHKGVGFVDAAVKKTLTNRTIEIWGDGEVVRDYIYIEDVSKMIYALIDYVGEEEVFNISSNEGISQKQVIEILHQLQLNPRVEYKDKRSVDVPKIVLDNYKINTVYKESIMLFKEGVEKYIEYLQKENYGKNEVKI